MSLYYYQYIGFKCPHFPDCFGNRVVIAVNVLVTFHHRIVEVCFVVWSDLDVIVVLETVFYVVEEGEDVNSVQAAVQQSVHALECSLPQVQTIIHRVFERTHLHLHAHAHTHTS